MLLTELDIAVEIVCSTLQKMDSSRLPTAPALSRVDFFLFFSFSHTQCDGLKPGSYWLTSPPFEQAEPRSTQPLRTAQATGLANEALTTGVLGIFARLNQGCFR